VIEIKHHLFQLFLWHLPVGKFDARFGDELLDIVRDLFDGFDFVVQHIDLAAAFQFALAGLLDQRVVPLCDEGIDRVALHRWCRDDGQVTDAGQ